MDVGWRGRKVQEIDEKFTEGGDRKDRKDRKDIRA